MRICTKNPLDLERHDNDYNGLIYYTYQEFYCYCVTTIFTIAIVPLQCSEARCEYGVIPLWRRPLWRMPVWRFHYGAGPAWRIPVWRVPVRRRAGVALFRYGAFQYGADPAWRIPVRRRSSTARFSMAQFLFGSSKS